jgi:hypothetical protein
MNVSAAQVLQYTQYNDLLKHSRELDITQAQQNQEYMKHVVDVGFSIKQQHEQLIVEMKEHAVAQKGRLIDTYA